MAFGDPWSAANNNTYNRDNINQLWPYTTAGDLAYATGATALARLGIGSAGQVLTPNSGLTAPEWAAILNKRQGGSATVWATAGTNDYTPAATFMQAGVVTLVIAASDTGTITVTFPTAFSNTPIVLITMSSVAADIGAGDFVEEFAISGTPTTTQFIARLQISAVVTTSPRIAWIALGPP